MVKLYTVVSAISIIAAGAIYAGDLTVNVVNGEIDLINVPGLSVVNIVEGALME